MRSSVYTVVFSVLLGGLVAALLTWAGRFTAPYRQANAQAEEYRHVLHVLGIDFARGATSRELLAVFERHVEPLRRGELTLYAATGRSPGGPRAVAVRLDGPGVWGPIRGFIAFDPSFRTITGITFYHQEETPGLGGEIASGAFIGQFKGKSTTGREGATGIRLVKPGGTLGANEVDAISGATMTCNKVEALINRVLQKVVEGGPRS